jgi:hypothetical protein
VPVHGAVDNVFPALLQKLISRSHKCLLSLRRTCCLATSNRSISLYPTKSKIARLFGDYRTRSENNPLLAAQFAKSKNIMILAAQFAYCCSNGQHWREKPRQNRVETGGCCAPQALIPVADRSRCSPGGMRAGRFLEHR